MIKLSEFITALERIRDEYGEDLMVACIPELNDITESDFIISSPCVPEVWEANRLVRALLPAKDLREVIGDLTKPFVVI